MNTESAILSTPRGGHARPALYVGLVADAPLAPSLRVSLDGIDGVMIGRADARRVATVADAGLELGLADTRLSSRHARLTRLGDAWAIEDLGSKNGTWIGREQIVRRRLLDGDAIRVGHTMLVYRDAGGEDGLRDAAMGPPLAPGLATISPVLAARFEELARAATSRVPIEIHGATGTGKELVARAVHALSGRRGAFVAVNCGALAASLVEAELFGHKRGAFTGADVERHGLIRAAHDGTLFLDEIAELAPAAQATLLRVLQEGEVLPVGADRAIAVDVRLITATHADVAQAVEAGAFRADLRARLLGVQLALPALRERPEDLGVVVAALLARAGRTPRFSADAASALYGYAWPLNIRELERALTAALAVAGELVELHHLPIALRSPPPPAPPDEDAALRARLVAALARHAGNLAAVARELGRDRTQIRRWMKRFGLSRGDYG